MENLAIASDVKAVGVGKRCWNYFLCRQNNVENLGDALKKIILSSSTLGTCLKKAYKHGRYALLG